MIDEETTLVEVAAVVSQALEEAGIVATLSGGAAVSIYSENAYESVDLDFVTAAFVDELKAVLLPLGFVHSGQPRLSVFEHPRSKWYVEFPPAPLSFGGTYVDPSDCARIDAGPGHIRVITPTHSVMDRLAAAAAWNEPQSMDQALLVAKSCGGKIDWKLLDDWIVNEEMQRDQVVLNFYNTVNREPPGSR